MAHSTFLIQSTPVIPVSKKGRPPGSGVNCKLLSKLATGQSLWDVPLDKMRSLRSSAAQQKIKISIREQPNSKPGNELYAIFRL